MNIVIGLIFSFIYIIESVFIFFLTNNAKSLTPMLISGVSAIVLLTISSGFTDKVSATHPHWVFTGFAVGIAIVLFFVLIFFMDQSVR